MGREVNLVTEDHEGWNSYGKLWSKVKSARWKDSPLDTLCPRELSSGYSVAKSCLFLCNTIDCNSPGSSVYGISQAESWSGLPYPSLRDLPHPWIEPTSSSSPALAGRYESWEAQPVYPLG